MVDSSRLRFRSTRRWSSLLSLTLAALLGAASARAEPRGPLDKDADAERLFREGQKLMEDRRYGEACPKFEAAYRKDQQLGTLLNLAYCHKEQGAIWLAWLEFKESELKAIELKKTDRKDFARQRMAELEKQLAKVVLDSPQKADVIEVLVEDRRVPDAEKGQVFAAEPGQRKFTFRAKGKKQVVQLVNIVRGDKPQKIPVPEMEDQPKEPEVAPPPPQPEEPKPKEPEVKATPSSQGMAPMKIAGFVAIGAGVVGAGIGSYFGLRTLNNECTDGVGGCTADQRATASSNGTIATVAFTAAGALIIGGTVLVLAAPSSDAKPSAKAPAKIHVRPEVGLGWAGLRGSF